MIFIKPLQNGFYHCEDYMTLIGKVDFQFGFINGISKC